MSTSPVRSLTGISLPVASACLVAATISLTSVSVNVYSHSARRALISAAVQVPGAVGGTGLNGRAPSPSTTDLSPTAMPPRARCGEGAIGATLRSLRALMMRDSICWAVEQFCDHLTLAKFWAAQNSERRGREAQQVEHQGFEVVFFSRSFLLDSTGWPVLGLLEE